MTRSITGLPAYIKECEIAQKIVQSNGISYQADAKAMAATRENICGVCFAGHVADFFETKISKDRVEDVIIYDEENNNSIFKMLIDNNIEFIENRDYEDGVNALYNAVKDTENFKKWLADSIFYNDTDLEAMTIYVMEEYMKEFGAPENCFDSDDWPKDIKPHKVAQAFVDAHPEIH